VRRFGSASSARVAATSSGITAGQGSRFDRRSFRR